MWDQDVIQAFAFEHWPQRPVAAVALQPLRGGLETSGVARAVARDKAGRQIGSFVVKRLTGTQLREIELLERAERFETNPRVTPRLLAHRGGYAFIEWVRTARRWPWGNAELALSVVDQLARVHSWPSSAFAVALGGWDYEAELRESAAATEAAYRTSLVSGIRPAGRPMLAVLHRVAGAIPEIRRQLLEFFGATVLHGDVHPGNVVVRTSVKGNEVLLLDWGRARIGSPLEDLSSWVTSVGFWEPEVRRVHDTVLRRYLASRGSAQSLSAQFRDACCLAGASNALSGALRYHLAVLRDGSRSRREQRNSLRAAADWLRIIRRADACLRR
jgi:hypothetical protein